MPTRTKEGHVIQSDQAELSVIPVVSQPLCTMRPDAGIKYRLNVILTSQKKRLHDDCLCLIFRGVQAAVHSQRMGIVRLLPPFLSYDKCFSSTTLSLCYCKSHKFGFVIRLLFDFKNFLFKIVTHSSCSPSCCHYDEQSVIDLFPPPIQVCCL